MTSEHAVITCIDCGKNLSDFPNTPDKQIPCPDCGSLKRNIAVTIQAELHLSASVVSSKVEDLTGFVKQESITKESHSEKTGRPVTITKEVDRTNLEYTTFHHKIEELDEHGILSRTIHEHTDIYPAKRRPSKKDK
jgi:hypothetical protein